MDALYIDPITPRAEISARLLAIGSMTRRCVEAVAFDAAQYAFDGDQKATLLTFCPCNKRVKTR